MRGLEGVVDKLKQNWQQFTAVLCYLGLREGEGREGGRG